MKSLKNISIIHTALIVIAILILHGLILHFMGQIAICKCGYIKLWHGIVVSSENSQHITDWYTFSHIIHGFIFYFILWLINKKCPIPWKVRLFIALGLEMGWELFENTDFIINRYRESTIALDYYGDNIVNSVSDMIAMAIGFVLARKIPVFVSILLIVAMELFVGLTIHDNLILNVIMLIHPFDFIKEWQMS